MLFTKFREIKLMNHIIQTNSNHIIFAVYPSINSIQEGSTKYNGTKAILWGTKNKKISGIFNFPTQDFNIPNNPNCEIVSLLASLIVTSIYSIPAGDIMHNFFV